MIAPCYHLDLRLLAPLKPWAPIPDSRETFADIIVAVVRDNPGRTTGEIIALVPAYKRQKVAMAIANAKKSGRLRSKGKRWQWRYYAV